MDLTLLRSQHYLMKNIIEELHELLKDDDAENNLLLISLKIGTLNGILTMHLHFEDDYLYPELLKARQEDVKHTVQNFQDYMGDLSIQFTHFLSKYLKEPVSITDFDTFAYELKEMLTRILSRIEHEEYELFPMLR